MSRCCRRLLLLGTDDDDGDRHYADGLVPPWMGGRASERAYTVDPASKYVIKI